MPTPILPFQLAASLLAGERARPVPTASRYWVTDRGRIFSLIHGLRELAPVVTQQGYHGLTIWRTPDECEGGALPVKWRTYVHEVVALAFDGPRPRPAGPACHIDHIDGDKSNNAAPNLEYVTASENMRRAIRDGRHPAKLTERDVVALREIASSQGMDAAVSRAETDHGLQRSAAEMAITGRSWAWVPHPSVGDNNAVADAPGRPDTHGKRAA